MYFIVCKLYVSKVGFKQANSEPADHSSEMEYRSPPRCVMLSKLWEAAP